MNTVCKVALGVILGLCVLIGGCVALVGVGVNEASKEADKTAITQSDWRKVKTGMSKDEVADAIGKPDEDKQQEWETETPESLGGGTVSSDCWYYAKPGDLGLPSYQVCFNDRDKVDSRNKF